MYFASSDRYDLCPMGNLAAMGNLAEMAGGEAQPRADGLELTIVLPCLNEAETVGAVRRQGRRLAARRRASPAR